MIHLEFEKLEDFFESLDYLGFAERSVYKIEANLNQPSDEILRSVLESDMFFKTTKGEEYTSGTSVDYTIRSNGAFTDDLEVRDFNKLNYQDLIKKIDEFERDINWGVDLPVFQKLINHSKCWIEKENYENDQFFFINSDLVPQEKLIDPNYYNYFISIVIISFAKSRVVIINHGGD
jgi:hypothetical protein